MESRLCSVVLFALLGIVKCQRYIVPEATVELLSPRGLRISIPDNDPDIKLVAFHININEEFQGLEHGHFAQDILKKKAGRWNYYIPDFKIKQGDVIYYWIHVVVENLGYNGLDREYRVTQANPHGGGSTVTTTSPKPPVQDLPCKTSQSTRLGDRPVCQGEDLLDTQFDSLDGWSHQVTIGGNYPEDEFMVFTKDSSNSWLENGKLFIKPTLLEEKYNDSFVRSGELLLLGCTSPRKEHCVRQAQTYLILPPIISARLTTKDKFSFRYGTVEIKAKLPSGDWIVPELWLEAVSGEATERIVLGLSRGNQDDSRFGSGTLEAGVLSNSQQSYGKIVQELPWSQDFHNFKLHWTPDEMQFSVDNQEIHRISSKHLSVLNREVYISLGVHVAGSRDFRDNPDKPWKNSDPKPLVWENYKMYIAETYEKMERFARFWEAKNSWYPSWKKDSSFQVESIKISAL